MIGNFARLTRSGSPRTLLDADEAATADAPPERFVHKVSDEAGDVYLAPVLDSLREALRARRPAAGNASTPEPETTTPESSTEAA